jgi:hypothetical protein
MLEETLIQEIADKLNIKDELEQKLVEKTLEALEQLRMLKHLPQKPDMGGQRGLSKGGQGGCGKGESGTFALSLEEYLEMDSEEQKRIQLKSYEEHQDWIEYELQLRNAEWIIVCNGEVIKFSQHFDEYPSDDELMEIGKRFNRIPFVFVKTPLIEEIAWAQVSAWDYYPTLEIILGKAGCREETLIQQGETIIADLDTGCPYIFVNYDEVLAKQYILPGPFRYAQARYHLGVRYLFYVIKLAIGIRDVNGALKCMDIPVHCVENWLHSPFCYVNTKRKALAGRNLLLKFPLMVKLSGKARSSIVSHE